MNCEGKSRVAGRPVSTGATRLESKVPHGISSAQRRSRLQPVCDFRDDVSDLAAGIPNTGAEGRHV